MKIRDLFKKLDGGDIMLAVVEIFGAIMAIAFLWEIGWCGILLVLGFVVLVIAVALFNKWKGEKKHEEEYFTRLH